MYRVHGDDDRNAQTAFLAPCLNLVQVGYSYFRSGSDDVVIFILQVGQLSDQDKTDILIPAPFAQVVRGRAVSLRNEGRMLHLGDLLPDGHLAQKISGSCLRIFSPVFINIQFTVLVQVFELKTVYFNNNCGVIGSQRMLLIRTLDESEIQLDQFDLFVIIVFVCKNRKRANSHNSQHCPQY